MLQTFQGSKERLGRPIDMLQLHWPPSLGWQELNYLDAFADVVASKEARRDTHANLTCTANDCIPYPPHIRQIGMSNFGPKGLRRIDKLMQERSCKVHSNQVRFALLCRSFSTSFVIHLWALNFGRLGSVLTP